MVCNPTSGETGGLAEPSDQSDMIVESRPKKCVF